VYQLFIPQSYSRISVLSLTPTEYKIINYCRIFLHVHRITDLTLAGGNHIDFSLLALDPSLLFSAPTLIGPLKDRPQTASALRLWQRANQLWCNTVTGGLHQPLGKWLVPGPQLRRSWPFYLDPDTKTLWSRTGEAKLNIEADKLAEEAYSSSTFPEQVPMIPGVSAQLLIDGKTIVSKHGVITRDIRRTTAIKL
jgi:hypothetical protein